MSTCRCLARQNWLRWQRPLTEVRQILAAVIFFIDGVNAQIRVVIRPPTVE